MLTSLPPREARLNGEKLERAGLFQIFRHSKIGLYALHGGLYQVKFGEEFSVFISINYPMSRLFTVQVELCGDEFRGPVRGLAHRHEMELALSYAIKGFEQSLDKHLLALSENPTEDDMKEIEKLWRLRIGTET